MKATAGILLILLLLAQPAMTQNSPTKTGRFLALGDSYTIGESVDPAERWPDQLVAGLKKKGRDYGDLQIIATTGWRTDDLKRAIESKDPKGPFDLVSLLIGVNNQYQGKSPESYAPEFEELLKMAIAFAGGDKSKVFVVSIPDYGFTPFGLAKKESITSELDAYNKINKDIATRYGIRYFDITPISRKGLEQPDLVAADGLHPSGKMYTEWVKLILQGL